MNVLSNIEATAGAGRCVFPNINSACLFCSVKTLTEYKLIFISVTQKFEKQSQNRLSSRAKATLKTASKSRKSLERRCYLTVGVGNLWGVKDVYHESPDCKTVCY